MEKNLIFGSTLRSVVERMVFPTRAEMAQFQLRIFYLQREFKTL